MNAIKSEFEILLGENLNSIIQMAGGRNSSVYTLITSSGIKYVGKRYFKGDERTESRMNTEFNTLTFLRGQGFQDVPKPIKMDKSRKCAIYEFMEGASVNPNKATPSDIQSLIDFMSRLCRLSRVEANRSLPDASEACFSAVAANRAIQIRLERLLASAHGSVIKTPLNAFLTKRFQPAHGDILEWTKEGLSKTPFPYFAILPRERRTLSPSDFGFHNALKQQNGGMVFLDFEYFGWDDPAKMICDALLHPAMTLTGPLKSALFSGMIRLFPDPDALKERVASLYPLLGLNWCLILLNEFILPDMTRRQFSSGTSDDPDMIRLKQLAKAETLLARILAEGRRFSHDI